MCSSSRSRGKGHERADDQDTIAITISWKPRDIIGRLRWIFGMKFGQGRSSSSSSALARPYRQLFKIGKPIGKVNYVFFKVNKWPSQVLGSLCFTPGKRLLFYPGLLERKVNWIFTKKDRFEGIKSTGFVDHITLEKGFSRWHVTVLEPDESKQLRMPSNRPKQINKHVIFWFAITIQSPSVLETTPEELNIAFPSPPRDSDRRIKLLIRAREKAIFHLITLNQMPFSRGEFLHFDFFLGPKKLTHKLLPCYVPTKEPIVSCYAQAFEDKTHFRRHPVSLEGITRKIWIVASKHKGKVSDKAIITCP